MRPLTALRSYRPLPQLLPQTCKATGPGIIIASSSGVRRTGNTRGVDTTQYSYAFGKSDPLSDRQDAHLPIGIICQESCEPVYYIAQPPIQLVD